MGFTLSQSPFSSPVCKLFFFGSVEILLNGCWFVGGDDLIEALHDL